MNEKYVTSLDLSKRLKELGIPQESEWYWIRKGHYYSGGVEYKPGKPLLTNEKPSYDFPYEVVASAFHVGELGDLLPTNIVSGRYYPPSHYAAWIDGSKLYSITNDQQFEASTEAEARGLMLEYLAKEGLLK